MFFGKKEDMSKLPDLPPLPGARDSHEQMMPEFPDMPEQSHEMGGMKPPMKDSFEAKPAKVVEMEEWHPRKYSISEPEEVEEEVVISPPQEKPMMRKPMHHPPQPVQRMAQPMPQAQNDVFVRIDKFHSARKALGEIQGKLEDIDELVKRIRDTKMREEQELAGWEKDLVHVKSRIQAVAENIFEKVE